MEDVTSEIVMIKYASLCATELGERIMRLNLEDAGELPDPSNIVFKQVATMPHFLSHHVHRNLLTSLCHLAFGDDLDPILLAAIHHLYTCTTLLTNTIIPLDMSEVDPSGNFVDVYLVKEECVIRVEKTEKVNFYKVNEDSKYGKNMLHVIQAIECFRTMSTLLKEKERPLRMERYYKEMLEYQKTKKAAAVFPQKDKDSTGGCSTEIHTDLGKLSIKDKTSQCETCHGAADFDSDEDNDN